MRRILLLSTFATLSATVAGQQAFLEWPLPASGQAYADIGGRHLHTYVVEQAAISRRYRDQGQPQFWGRITGTSGDAESAEWLAAHFKRIGMTDIRIQETPETVPWTGLEASTRAYARIIDGVNDLKDLQRPPEPEPGTGRR